MKCSTRKCDGEAVVLDSNNRAACARCAIASMVKRDPSIQIILDRKKVKDDAN